MSETGDRMDRAGRYVLGLMDGEERERAERDLEVDQAFRDAMVEVAERMHVFDRMPVPDAASQDGWRLIKQRIEAMPQMQPARPPHPAADEPGHDMPAKKTNFGRRKSDRLIVPAEPDAPTRVTGMGLHAVPGRRALALALCLVAVFALGYVAGKF